MKDTSRVGLISEIEVTKRLVAAGHTVSTPVGNSAPYDLIVDDGQRLIKVQVKTGSIICGALTFNAAYGLNSTAGRRLYSGLVDVIVVYCPDNDKVYWFDVEELGTNARPSFRVHEAKNNQTKGIRWASNYEL